MTKARASQSNRGKLPLTVPGSSRHACGGVCRVQSLPGGMPCSRRTGVRLSYARCAG
jgi:hypothetical protein